MQDDYTEMQQARQDLDAYSCALEELEDKAKTYPADLNDRRIASLRDLAERHESERHALRDRQTAERVAHTRALCVDHDKLKLDLKAEIQMRRQQIINAKARIKALEASEVRLGRMQRRLDGFADTGKA